MTTSRVVQGRRPRSLPGATLIAIALVLTLVTACDMAIPAPSGASPLAGLTSPSSATGSAKPAASTRPGASATPSRAASTPAPTPTPTPTVPTIVGATQTPCPGTTTSAKRGNVALGQSRNWAGYIIGATKGHVTCVEGTWTQPKVRCPATGQTSMAAWVGIDGASAAGGLPDASATLAQTGTIGDCDRGQARYAAWFEFLPDLQRISIMAVPVGAGDHIWAQIRWRGKGKFVATLINLTRRIGDTKTWVLRQAPLLTAEWVVEEPAAKCSGSSCTFVTLARFSTITLNGAVTIAGRRYRLPAVPFPHLRTSISKSGQRLAVPSTLSSRGFSVVWKAS